MNFYIFPTINNKFGCKYVIVLEAEATLKLKNNTLALDAIDYRILEALQEDSRQTYTAIGKTLGMAHSTVYDRIRRMEQYGVIKKYTTVIDAEKSGARSITAMMTVYTDPKESEKVAEKLSKAPQVVEVYTSLSEELQIIAKVVAENQENLHEFIANSVAPLPGVLRIRTSIVTKKFKENQFSIANDPKKLTFIKGTHNIKGEK
jgi:Lrp/AsnC family leucine-responsive transcriptional regulator